MKFVLVLLLRVLPCALSRPCDVFAAGGTPCVAAHSTVRALFAAGAPGARLYRLQRRVDNATLDIAALRDGFADTAAHDAFCAHGVGPLPPPAPIIGSIVTLTSALLPDLSLRHCYSQAFVTPSDGGADHAFRVVAALNGDSGAVSFQSTNYPTNYIAPVTGAEPGRVGIAPAPAPSDASWSVTPTAGGAVTLSLASRGGAVMSVGWNITGTCAASYAPPSASVYLLPPTPLAPAQEWTLVASGYPSLAACFIAVVYDQTSHGNDLPVAGPGINNHADDLPVNASRHAVAVSGGARRVYGMYFETGMGYRAVNTTGVAKGNDPETLYAVMSGTHVNGFCCFDYGSSEDDPTDPAAFVDGGMEAINLSKTDVSGTWCGGAGHEGPWVLADLENGLWGCGNASSQNDANTPLPFPFVMAMLKGGAGSFALKGGDATRGSSGLKTMYDGPRPPGYNPMRKSGAIILGVGGDNRRRRLQERGEGRVAVPGLSVGTFYEGVLTTGYSTDAVDSSVAADIAGVGWQEVGV